MKNSLLGWAPVGCVLGGLLAISCSSERNVDPRRTEGRLMRGTADFDDGHSEKWYFLATEDGASRRLLFKNTPGIPVGSELAVYGAQEGDAIRVDDYELVRLPEEARPAYNVNTPPLTPPQKILWISLESTVDAKAADQILNNDYKGIKKYFGTASFGIWTTDITTVGPYAPSMSGCNTDALQKGAEASAKAAGVDVDSFVQVQTLMPKSANCSYSFGLDGHTPLRTGMPRGKFERSSFVTGASCSLLNQEIGHNYGLSHSHFCPNADPPAKNCSGFKEYGDPFTAMASGCGQFNAWERLQMDWFRGCNVVVAQGAGSYEIAPIHVPCNGPQVIMIAADMGSDAQRYYYIEYRKSHANDTTNGILVHYSTDPKKGGWTGCDWGGPDCPFQWIVDVKKNGDASKAILNAGDEWTSPQSAKIKIDSLGETAKITVSGVSGSGALCYLDNTPLANPKPDCSGGEGGAGGGGAGGGGAGGSAGTGGRGGAGGGAGTGGRGGAGGAGTGGTAGTGGAGTGGSATTSTGAAGATTVGSGGAGTTGGAGGAAGAGTAGAAGSAAGAGGSSSGSAGRGTTGAGGSADQGDGGGCSCRTASAPSAGGAWAPWLLSAAAAFLGRRRRRA